MQGEHALVQFEDDSSWWMYLLSLRVTLYTTWVPCDTLITGKISIMRGGGV
jgi:hypothetical protein